MVLLAAAPLFSFAAGLPDTGQTACAYTDGLVILRYLLGLRGDSLIADAVGPGATRVTAADIEAYIQLLMP